MVWELQCQAQKGQAWLIKGDGTLTSSEPCQGGDFSELASWHVHRGNISNVPEPENISTNVELITSAPSSYIDFSSMPSSIWNVGLSMHPSIFLVIISIIRAWNLEAEAAGTDALPKHFCQLMHTTAASQCLPVFPGHCLPS